jgi:hypothetical protein
MMFRNVVQQRHDQMGARLERAVELPQPLNKSNSLLPDDPNRVSNKEDHRERNDKRNDQ